MNEAGIIQILKEASASRQDVTLGIGDDAAVVDGNLAICQDTLNVHVHFRDTDPADAIGHKVLAVNLSDLAAMGADPCWATLSLSLPDANESWIAAFAEGFGRLARRYDVALIGGDTTRGPMSISVTALGRLEGAPLRRGEAGLGDDIWVSGFLGDAAAGLEDDFEDFRQRLLYPEPRIALGKALGGLATACMDLSDGLGSDLPRLLGPRHGAYIEIDDLPLSEALLERMPDPVRLAVCGGDDYELCFTAPVKRREAIDHIAASLDMPIRRIGTVTEATQGMIYRDSAGQRKEPGSGYDHFA